MGVRDWRQVVGLGVLGLCAVAAGGWGAMTMVNGVESAAVASPRTDANSKLAHEQLVAKAKKGGIDVYFLGDSITRRWGCTDPQYAEMMANWRKNFFGWNAANFGWGADRIQNMLWRVENGELAGVNLKVIVILAGTNNVGTGGVSEEKEADIVKGMGALVGACRARAPGAVVILTAIMPREDVAGLWPEIRRVNEGVKKLADGERVLWLDVNAGLADGEGKLVEGVTVDKLHLSVKGYQVWADGLRPMLTKLLGEPRKVDHAPAATGDPSAAKPAGGS